MIGHMNALVDGKAGNLAKLMVDVRADGAHPIGAEDHVVRGLVIGFKKNSFAAHAFPLFIQFC